MQSWKYKYGENEIDVMHDTISNKSELYVNGQLQDKNTMMTTELNGKLESGETIRARVGGFFTIKCALQIDNKLLQPIH